MRISRLLLGLMACFVLWTNLFAEEPAADTRHWSYRPIVRPSLPEVRNAGAVRSPVDAFVQFQLEEAGQSLASPADKITWLRRVKFDLLGLPVEPAEVDEFLADVSPTAYEQVVDRYLARPQYGERWGRMWLDVVRYADTAGYNADPLRPLAWKYRDYVIKSFNDDKPYDRFLQEQLAGDELFPDSEAALIATGFQRLAPDESNASNVALARQDLLNDLTTNLGAALLAQSIGCAQCHDHKFDDLSQKDFYKLQAFFAGIIPVDKTTVGTPAELDDYQQRLTAWRAETESLRHELHKIDLAARIKTSGDKRMKFPEAVLAALDTPAEDRTALQLQYTFFAERQMEYKDSAIQKAMSAEDKARRKELTAALKAAEARKPQPPRQIEAMVSVDGRATPDTHLLAGGSYNKPEDLVVPGFPNAIDFSTSHDAQLDPPRAGTPGRRTALARWLCDPRNPLVARVWVNRIWQGHFGRGIVENANDFGVQTAPPTHPELLDWLAAELVEPTVAAGAPWSMKRLHRLIVTSSTYRQMSRPADATTDATEDARLFQYFPRRRLDAEVLRDSLLAVSGSLNLQMTGPGMYPALPPGVASKTAWPVSPLDQQNRRSVYILQKRNLPFPLLQVFDQPDMFESCACRSRTLIAPQALWLFNSDTILEYAQSLAGRLLTENPHGEETRLVRDGFRATLGREPTRTELQDSLRFLASQRALAQTETSSAAAAPVPQPRPYPKFLPPEQGAAVVDFCHALFNLSEFVYVD